MKLYVGLDVGLEETSLCIVDREGLTVREVRSTRSRTRSASLLKATRIASIGSVSKRRRSASGCTVNFSRPGSRSLLSKPPYACLAVDDAQ